MRLLFCLALSTTLLAACGLENDGSPDDAATDAVVQSGDGATHLDATRDGTLDDAALADADGSTEDASTEDASVDDASVQDATPDARADADPREPMNHRPMAPVCSRERELTPFEGEPDRGECSSHDDCTDGENGRCGYTRIGTQCTYDVCFADTECTDGERGVCACESDTAANHCLYGGCLIDSDCGAGGYCSPTFGSCGNYFGVIGYFCHTPEDECLDDSECTADEGSFGPGYCAYSEEAGHWLCQYSHCVG